MVTLNPVNNQTGKRHFSCVSMATNLDLHRTSATPVHCELLEIFSSFSGLLTSFFSLLSRNLNFSSIYIFCLMPSFTKAKTFAKCPLMSFWELLLLFLLFLSTIFVHVFQLTLEWLPWASSSYASAILNLKTCPAKKKYHWQERHISLNGIEDNWEVNASFPK